MLFFFSCSLPQSKRGEFGQVTAVQVSSSKLLLIVGNFPHFPSQHAFTSADRATLGEHCAIHLSDVVHSCKLHSCVEKRKTGLSEAQSASLATIHEHGPCCMVNGEVRRRWRLNHSLAASKLHVRNTVLVIVHLESYVSQTLSHDVQYIPHNNIVHRQV